MQNYLYITVSAVIFLTLCQTILPNGSMKNISKMVVSIVFLIVLALPIIELISNSDNFKPNFDFDKSYYAYLDEIENVTIKNEVENVLKKYNFSDFIIQVETNDNKKIVNIFLKNVINENIAHIDSIDKAKDEILNKCLSNIAGVEFLIE